MSDNRILYTEEAIFGAVKCLLTEKVNELLGDLDFPVPLVEFSNYGGTTAVVLAITLATCEQSEKERIVQLDAYTLTITFSFPETPESEIYCYAYSAAVRKALEEDTTLDGVANRTVITGKKYVSPKKPNCGQGWELVITLRITVEEMNNAG
jgi:hypothetical protein